MNTLYKPKMFITCKTRDTKNKKKKVPKYTIHRDLKLEMNNNDNILKKFFIKFLGEEIDYEKFNNESKWAIRINEDDTDGKTKKW